MPDAAATVPPALALLEFDSIAVGTRATDALIKKAPVVVERVGTIQPGRFVVLFCGDVASVDESYGEALRVGGTAIADRVLLPHIDTDVRAAVLGHVDAWEGDTLGVIETSTLAPAIEAADAAVKGANVRIVQVRLGDELGGKGLCHVAGEIHDVEAALEIATERVTDGKRVVQTSITPRLDDDFRAALARTTRFWGEG